jgi:hypothetical protein
MFFSICANRRGGPRLLTRPDVKVYAAGENGLHGPFFLAAGERIFPGGYQFPRAEVDMTATTLPAGWAESGDSRACADAGIRIAG